MKRALAFGLGLAAAAALQGCSLLSPTTLTWYKSGATYQQFLDNRYACVIEARGSTSGGAIYNDTTIGQRGQVIPASVFTPCMRAKGWAVDPNSFEPPDDSVSVNPDG